MPSRMTFGCFPATRYPFAGEWVPPDADQTLPIRPLLPDRGGHDRHPRNPGLPLGSKLDSAKIGRTTSTRVKRKRLEMVRGQLSRHRIGCGSNPGAQQLVGFAWSSRSDHPLHHPAPNHPAAGLDRVRRRRRRVGGGQYPVASEWAVPRGLATRSSPSRFPHRSLWNDLPLIQALSLLVGPLPKRQGAGRKRLGRKRKQQQEPLDSDRELFLEHNQVHGPPHRSQQTRCTRHRCPALVAVTDGGGGAPDAGSLWR